MHTILIPIIIVFNSLTLMAQKQIAVYIQSPSNDRNEMYNLQNYDSRSMFTENHTWTEITHNKAYSIDLNAIISLTIVDRADWQDSTKAFIEHLSSPNNLVDLWVYVGYNSNTDSNYDTTYINCEPSMLFGRNTHAWPVDNVTVNTKLLIAPETYMILPAIEMWLKGYNDGEIRLMCANEYAKLQKISLKEAKKIFRISDE